MTADLRRQERLLRERSLSVLMLLNPRPGESGKSGIEFAAAAIITSQAKMISLIPFFRQAPIQGAAVATLVSWSYQRRGHVRSPDSITGSLPSARWRSI